MKSNIKCLENKPLSNDDLLDKIKNAKMNSSRGLYLGRIAYIIDDNVFVIKTHEDEYFAVYLHNGKVREISDDFTSNIFIESLGVEYIFKSDKIVEVQVGCDMDLIYNDKTYGDMAKMFVSLRGTSKACEQLFD